MERRPWDVVERLIYHVHMDKKQSETRIGRGIGQKVHMKDEVQGGHDMFNR